MAGPPWLPLPVCGATVLRWGGQSWPVGVFSGASLVGTFPRPVAVALQTRVLTCKPRELPTCHHSLEECPPEAS